MHNRLFRSIPLFWRDDYVMGLITDCAVNLGVVNNVSDLWARKLNLRVVLD